MSELSRGRVVSVVTRTAGDVLAEAATSGATTLVVDDVYPFSEDGGGLSIDGSNTILYTATDDDASTITLAAPLADDYEAGAVVDALPLAPEKVASIVQDDEGEAIPARVLHTLDAFLPEGVRDPDAQESVLLLGDGDEWVVLDVIGRPAQVDGAAVVGPLPNADLSDGFPPPSSPTPVTIAGLRQVFVKWDLVVNKDLVKYQVHVTTDPDAAVPVPDDPATMLDPTPATMVAVSALPDGTPPEYDTTYYFAVIATDLDGAAEPSPWVAGQMDRAASGDLVAGAVTTETLDAVLAILGLLQIGGGLIELSPPTAEDDGQGGLTLGGGIIIRDPANPTGEPLVRLHPNGCTFRGQVVADIITVLQDLLINGDARLASGSTFTLSNGVADPIQAPTLSQGPQALQGWPAAPSGRVLRGLCWDPDNEQWWQLLERTSDHRAIARTVDLGGEPGPEIVLSGPSGRTYLSVSGIAYNAGKLFYTAKMSWSGLYAHVLIRTTTSGGYETSAYGTAASSSSLVPGQAAVAPVTYGGISSNMLFAYPAKDSWDSWIQIEERSSASLTWDASYEVPGGPGIAADSSLRGVSYGETSYDGSSKYTLVAVNRAWVYNDDLPMSEDEAHSWDLNGGSVYNGGAAYSPDYGWVTANGDGNLYRWSDYYPDDDGVWTAKYVDTDGAQHTKASPARTIAVDKRRYVVASLPPAPAGITGFDLYVGYDATGAASTLYKRDETSFTRSVMLLDGKQTTGSTSVPTTNTLGGSAAEIASEVGGGILRGDGSGVWDLDRIRTSDPELLTALSPFSGSTITLQRVGNLVIATGYISRSGSFSTTFTACADIPTGFRPHDESALIPASAVFNSTNTFQFWAHSATAADPASRSKLELRQSATTSLAMAVNAAWVTADSWPA